MAGSRKKVKTALDRLYRRYNRRELIAPDPLQFVYNYEKAADREIVGLLAASLAYGRVGQIEASLKRLLGLIGESPAGFVENFGRAERRKLTGFKHRFNTGDDISDMLVLLKRALKQAGSIENYFLRGYCAEDATVVPALTEFCESLLEANAAENAGRASKGLRYLLVSPSGTSACKRMNLFLRWMVRSDDVDPGVWTGVDASKLIVPVDVHMGRLCRFLGLYRHKMVSLAAALEITAGFAQIEPADPVKYDFALSRVGIVEDCNGNLRPECEGCELWGFCRARLGG